MQFIRGIQNLKKEHHGCVLTIGNFDGFHKGHQSIIENLKEVGSTRKLPSLAIIFEPQPGEFFTKQPNSIRINGLRDKIKYFREANVDFLLCINFNERFSRISAEDFIKHLLIQKLGMRSIVIGNDFRFGADRQGNVSFLEEMGKELHFTVSSIPTHRETNERISSTLIKEKLFAGELEQSEKLMGHSYRISGRVIRGRSIGRKIGFPTANISLKKRFLPICGVYAVEVNGIARHPKIGIANASLRTSIRNQYQLLEVHILDSYINLYNCQIEVVIRSKIRDEQTFSSLQTLQEQIRSDIDQVKKYYRSVEPN